jgi:hypothetical protein
MYIEQYLQRKLCKNMVYQLLRCFSMRSHYMKINDCFLMYVAENVCAVVCCCCYKEVIFNHAWCKKKTIDCRLSSTFLEKNEWFLCSRQAFY